MIDEILDTASRVCLNENMSAYSITDRTDITDDVTVITITQAVSNRVWTLISSATGRDVLVRPDGTQLDESRIMQAQHGDPNGAVAAVVEWITNNV